MQQHRHHGKEGALHGCQQVFVSLGTVDRSLLEAKILDLVAQRSVRPAME